MLSNFLNPDPSLEIHEVELQLENEGRNEVLRRKRTTRYVRTHNFISTAQFLDRTELCGFLTTDLG